MSPPRRSLRIGITVGDPSGVGPETVLKSLVAASSRASRTPPPGLAPRTPQPVAAVNLREIEFLLIGPEWIWSDTAERLGLKIRFAAESPRREEGEQGPPEFEVREPKETMRRFSIPYGRVNARCGAVAIRAIEQAVSMAMVEEIDAIVTAPIGKAAIRAAGSPFPGHTEMLQHLSGSPQVGMMLVGGGLRVSLVTIHEPYSIVPALLTPERILKAICLTNDFLKKRWGFNAPRLALAALNPHAGENGLFGDEEERTLAPALDRARKKGVRIDGPIPADTVFHFARNGEYDAVVALYHDQALIPIKTLDFHGGVNVTMGLPLVRTSPDHGTAYAIAGRGVAHAGSMANAIALAAELARGRRGKTHQ